METTDEWAEWLGGGPVVVAGDFNAGGSFNDQPEGTCHYRILDALGPFGLVSAAHAATGEKQGEESLPSHSGADPDRAEKLPEQEGAIHGGAVDVEATFSPHR